MTTEERLEKLEQELAAANRRNRWLLTVVGLAVLAAALAWTWNKTTAVAQAQQAAAIPKIVRAQGLVLEDVNGQVRASLGLFRGEWALRLLDEKGFERAILRVSKDGSALRLLAEEGRAGLTVGKDGAELLLDDKGKRRAAVAVDKNGAGLRLLDEKGKVRAGLGVAKDGPALSLYDESGNLIWSSAPPSRPAPPARPSRPPRPSLDTP